MNTALILLACILLLVDTIAHIFLACLILRIASGDIEAKERFKRLAIFVGLDRIPEPPPSDYPKF